MALTKDEIALELQAAVAPAEPVPRNAQVRVQDSFDAMSFDRCRRSHAEEALRQPQAIAAYEASDVRMILATKLVQPPHGDRFLLLIVAREQTGAYEAHAGFRLYSADKSLDELAGEPSQAFATFLDRYGVPYEAGGIKSKFTSLLLETGGIGGSLPFLSGVQPGGRMTVNVLVKPMPDHMEIVWPFVVDGNTYLADVDAAR